MFGPLVLGAVMARIKKLRDGWCTVLDGRCSIDLSNNHLNDGVGGGGAVERRFAWAERMGRTFSHRFGWRMERRKNELIEIVMEPRILMAFAG
jgi:hypothetical protein